MQTYDDYRAAMSAGCIVAGATLDEAGVKDFCRGQIAHYKVPRYVKFVDEFPMTVTGKMQKFVMRERMSRELGVRIPIH